MNSKPIEILLVEDNPGDARLTLEAFKEAKVINNFTVMGDGVEALAYLRRQGTYANSVQPDLILLDLNLPKKDGREVLAEIKADEQLMKTPVVVLTTSASEEDIARAYSRHANCYITKPVDLDQFLRVAQSIESFWLSLVNRLRSAWPGAERLSGAINLAELSRQIRQPATAPLLSYSSPTFSPLTRVPAVQHNPAHCHSGVAFACHTSTPLK